MPLRVGINGFGRIGRNVLRQLYGKASALGHSDTLPIEVVAINDLTDSKTLAHLLKFDSVHGKFDGEIVVSKSNITVNGHEIAVLAEKDPTKLPWRDLKVDVVLECTGIFTSKEKASVHLQNGAKKVIISAPSADPDVTIAMGVNHEIYQPDQHHIVSCASCTTNCLAPVAKVVLEEFGIVKGSMTTIHSYTNDQNILDLPHKDLRRARAGALSMIPTTTGAAKAVGLVIPTLKGKIDGFAVRVPTADVSLVDLVVELEREATVEQINTKLKEASQGKLRGILAYSDEPLVSIDYVGNTNSSIVDGLSTMVIQKRLAKVVAWYDNEMGFSARMIDMCRLMGESITGTSR